VLLGIVENGGVPDCAGASCFVTWTESSACCAAAVSAVLPPGNWWLYVAAFFQDESACVSDYTAGAIVRAPADLNADGIVGHDDFWMLLDAWGPCPAPDPCPADLDGDGLVGVTDFLVLLASWNE